MTNILKLTFGLLLYSLTSCKPTEKFILVSGKIDNAKTNSPVDSSVYITIQLGEKDLYKGYCNNEGKYSINLSDTLKGKQITVFATQDQKKVERMFASKSGEACSFICWDNLYFSSEGIDTILKTDSTNKYIVNFSLTPYDVQLRFSTIYFKKNEATMVQSDQYLDVDSALCNIQGVLKCKKKLVIEISGNCSPNEEDKENLSSKRAQVVKAKLTSLGINPDRIIAKGNSDKYYVRNRDYIEKSKALEGDHRPSYINKTDYEWQTVTISVLRSDFGE